MSADTAKEKIGTEGCELARNSQRAEVPLALAKRFARGLLFPVAQLDSVS